MRILTNIYYYRTEKDFFALSFYPKCFHNMLGPKIRKMVLHLPLLLSWQEGGTGKNANTPYTPEDVHQHFHSWNSSCTAPAYWYSITFKNQISLKNKQTINSKKRWELHMDKQGCLCAKHKSTPLPLKPLEYPHEHIPNFLLLETFMELSPSRQIKPKQQEILF